MTELKLHELARERLANGALLCDESLKTWAGRGTGVCCSLCDQPINAPDVEYEIGLGGVNFHFHMKCHAVWMQECTLLLQSRKNAV